MIDLRWIRNVANAGRGSAMTGALHDAADEIERLRAALVAAMEVVQRERTRIAYNAKGAPPAVEIGYADILRRLDAVIAQADAAMGVER